MSSTTLVVATGIALNIVSSVGCVLVNKYLFVEYSFAFATVLTCFHYLSNWFFLHIARQFNAFEVKDLPFRQLAVLAVMNSGSVVFLNLSLQLNSVGFYQITKLMVIPTTMLMQIAFEGQRFSMPTVLSIITLIVGVALATISEVRTQILGSAFAVLGVICTARSQIMTGTLQKEHKVNNVQLLYRVAPIMAAMLAPVAPFLDYVSNNNIWFFDYRWSMEAFAVLFSTCILALGVNYTVYLLVGKTSPVSFQVVGTAKTTMTLVFGIVMFNEPVLFHQVIGLVMAVGGMTAYSHFK
eukprot:TRINITY_DN6217_c0_g1_i1.p1 TRINITY_DN6217_c0_g1~~TRINITY_DN6217_c0_g1_i1.p1  ORF type:complete len:296 (-),score=53.33 TRINITY_DN6217_c0_g1_i1:116-1003(-)